MEWTLKNCLLAQAKAYLNLFTTHVLTVEDADLAASPCREHRWKLPDVLQAAMTINRQLTLATRNSKDFDPVRHAFVVIPYQLSLKQGK